MWHQVESHEKNCLHPQKNGLELLEGITGLASDAKDEIDRLKGLLKMLSYEKIAYCGENTNISKCKFCAYVQACMCITVLVNPQMHIIF